MELHEETRNENIEQLAESLIRAATEAAREVISSSVYDITMADTVGMTTHDDEFNELYYKIAERIINTSERY